MASFSSSAVGLALRTKKIISQSEALIMASFAGIFYFGRCFSNAAQPLI